MPLKGKILSTLRLFDEMLASQRCMIFPVAIIYRSDSDDLSQLRYGRSVSGGCGLRWFCISLRCFARAVCPDISALVKNGHVARRAAAAVPYPDLGKGLLRADSGRRRRAYWNSN